jgi:DNA-binding NarL/FixJ family response regulator
MTDPRKEDVPDALIEALRSAPTIAEWMIEEHARRATVSLGGHPAHEFNEVPTDDELKVLACLSFGMTNPMTAETLGKGLETVKTQIRTARYRLKAKTTIHAVAIAIRRGLIP